METKGNATVDGNSTVKGDSDVQGNTTIGKDLHVVGTSTLDGDVTTGAKSDHHAAHFAGAILKSFLKLPLKSINHSQSNQRIEYPIVLNITGDVLGNSF